MLSYQEVTYKVVDYSEVEEVIDEVFGFDRGEYSIPEGQETGNDTYLTASVTEYLDKYDSEDMAKALESKNRNDLNYRLQAAMCFCCLQGKIEPGEYLIRVSW